MGMLLKGKWEPFVGNHTNFSPVLNNRIVSEGNYPPEKDRYVLYVNYGCPWCQRTITTWAMKKLESIIPLVYIKPVMSYEGWQLDKDVPNVEAGYTYVHEMYTKSNPQFTGIVTLPILWDRQTKTIVSNDSETIMHILNRDLNEFLINSIDLYPQEFRSEIDDFHRWIIPDIFNAVSGINTTDQGVYEAHVKGVFASLNKLEKHLHTHRFLVNKYPTLVDITLFSNLLRFDSVYYPLFKCNLRLIAQYPNLFGYLRDLYQWPGVKEHVWFDHIKLMYYKSAKWPNPTGIIPLGPDRNIEIQNLTIPPNREQLL